MVGMIITPYVLTYYFRTLAGATPKFLSSNVEPYI